MKQKITNMKSNNVRFIIGILFLPVLLILTGCEDNTGLEDRTYQLVWQDEFDTDGAPDESKWVFDLGAGGWGNSELQTYTNDPKNIIVSNGSLKITAINNGGSFTSARIKTQGLFARKYGRFEARIKTPYGPGLWPAFWMLGENIETVAWPQCGEIDIMELRGQEPHIIHGTIHGPGYSGGNPVTKSYALLNSRFDVDFHLFAVEWDKDKIDFFVDDFLYQRIERKDVPGEWVYDQPFFLLLNVAVGGNYVGFPTPQTPFPQTMTVDYVRVYEMTD
jgi:beta-glucanase (GH16 family)